jgi:hypothetical protein
VPVPAEAPKIFAGQAPMEKVRLFRLCVFLEIFEKKSLQAFSKSG